MSPGTFVEYYRLLDITHRRHLTRQMSEWNFEAEGQLCSSTDFQDFSAFTKLCEILVKETAKERAARLSVFESSAETHEKWLGAKSIQKLIMANPQFLPRDQFYDIFAKLKGKIANFRERLYNQRFKIHSYTKFKTFSTKILPRISLKGLFVFCESL